MQGRFKVTTLCGSTRFRKRRQVPSGHRPQLVSSVANIRMNRKGVSYGSLFGAFLKTSRKITAVDERVQKSVKSNTNSQNSDIIKALLDCGVLTDTTPGIRRNKKYMSSK